jgi:hypothetical protein
MSPSTKNHQDLWEILLAVAWIDGEIQAEEKAFLSKIAAEQNLTLSEDLFTTNQVTSINHCYDLFQKYLGSNPTPQDYENLLSAVSTLIYSDNDIAIEEASILTKMQNLNSHNLGSHSTFDKLIGKIQKLYQAGVSRV